MSEQSLSATAVLLPADMAKVVPLQAEVINLPARGDVNYVRGGVVHGWPGIRKHPISRYA